MLRLCILLTLLMTQAHAGAWPRGKGKGFLATGVYAGQAHPDLPLAIYTTAYLEYGLSKRMTFGLDFGHAISGKTKSIGFLRYSIIRDQSPHVLSVEIGLGEIAERPVLRPGLSYGRGFTIGARRGWERHGWLAIDSLAEIDLNTGIANLKTDLTIGLNLSKRTKAMIQFQAGKSQTDPLFLRVVPSATLKIGRRAHIEIGAYAGLRGDGSRGVKLALWRDF